MALIYAVLTVPTPVLGPPGAYKIVLGILLGLIADLIVFLFKYKKPGYYLALMVANVLSLIFSYYALIILGLPGADQLKDYLVFFSLWYAFTAFLGSGIAIFLYERKVKNMRLVQQIGD